MNKFYLLPIFINNIYDSNKIVYQILNLDIFNNSFFKKKT